MMNTWSHVLAATALSITALIVTILMCTDSNTKALDKVRYYTMKRVPGDVDGAKAILDDDSKWPSAACQNAQNTTTTADACIVARRDLRNSILNKMNCFAYNSQVCTYLRNITAGIVQNRTYGGVTYYVGRALSGVIPGQATLTYRQLLKNAVEKAPLVFHGSYKAAQSDDSYILRTAVYNLIVITILANLLVHYFDQYEMTWTYRLIFRITVFLLGTFVPAICFVAANMGSAYPILFLIWLPALIVLIYYEAFLDASITRPWIHPFAFAIIYASTSVLALTENAVLNWQIICLAIGQAHAVSLLYMQIVWYWVGYLEKKTHNADDRVPGAARDLYETKEMQYALFLAIVFVGIIPCLQIIAPFDYDCSDVVIRGAPVVFVTLAVWGTLYLQSMQLSEYYGKDRKISDTLIKMMENNPHSKQVYLATRITSGKLAVSLLLLIFGVLYEFNLLGLYFRTLRAYNDKLPERAWQYDTANRFTIGTGFLPAPTLYL